MIVCSISARMKAVLQLEPVLPELIGHEIALRMLIPEATCGGQVRLSPSSAVSFAAAWRGGAPGAG